MVLKENWFAEVKREKREKARLEWTKEWIGSDEMLPLG